MPPECREVSGEGDVAGGRPIGRLLVDGAMTATQSVLGALVVTVLLVALHVAAPRIRRLPLVPEAVTGSFAGGLAVAYVFLHLLPELAEGNEAMARLSVTL